MIENISFFVTNLLKSMLVYSLEIYCIFFFDLFLFSLYHTISLQSTPINQYKRLFVYVSVFWRVSIDCQFFEHLVGRVLKPSEHQQLILASI